MFHKYLVTLGKNEYNHRYYHETFMTSHKFYHEIFILEQNSRIHKSFLPQKFGAIRYTYMYMNYVSMYVYVWNAHTYVYTCCGQLIEWITFEQVIYLTIADVRNTHIVCI